MIELPNNECWLDVYLLDGTKLQTELLGSTDPECAVNARELQKEIEAECGVTATMKRLSRIDGTQINSVKNSHRPVRLIHQRRSIK